MQPGTMPSSTLKVTVGSLLGGSDSSDVTWAYYVSKTAYATMFWIN